MKIANGVEMLDLEMQFMGRKQIIHPTLLFNENEAVLIDTGMPGDLKNIQLQMEKAGVPFEKLKAVVLTHADIDHIGSIEEILAEKSVPVYAHAEDKPYIQGEKEPLKVSKKSLEKVLPTMPEEIQVQMEKILNHPPQAKVTHTVEDGEVLPFFGGITVIFTPGHTPGHISLYHNESKTLITGDATASEEGKLLGPSERVTPDMNLALESLGKFANYEIKQAICYHGGLCNDNVNEQFKKLQK